MVAPIRRRSGRKSSQVRKICFCMWKWKIVVVAKLGNTRRSRVVTRLTPLTSHRSLTVWTRWKPHLQSQKKIGKIRKGVGNRSGFQDQSKVSQKYKKTRYAIGLVGEKDLSKIIKEFEKIGKLTYEKKRHKHEPTPRYFHIVRQIAKCMMRSDKFNRHNHGSYTEMTAPSLNVNVTDNNESKEIIVQKLYPRIIQRT